MILMLSLVLAVDIPRFYSTWKLPYFPEIALLNSNGESLVVNGTEAYVYDRDGNLIRDFSLPFAPEAGFSGPDNTSLLHDGENLLGCFSATGDLKWQRELEPPSAKPSVFGPYLVYACESHIQILDPADGSAKFSRYHDVSVSAILVHNGTVLIADVDGSIFSWNPETGYSKQVFEREQGLLRYAVASPEGKWVLVYAGGLLKVFQDNRRVRWKRDYRIDISTPPLWLRDNGESQLLVANQGRVIYAYAENGAQLARHLIQGRPKALIPWSETLCLLVPGFVNELIWYDSRDRKFVSQRLENYQNMVVVNGPFVMLVDREGLVQLFQRPLAEMEVNR